MLPEAETQQVVVVVAALPLVDVAEPEVTAAVAAESEVADAAVASEVAAVVLVEGPFV